MDFRDYVYPLTQKQVMELAKTYPDVNNVMVGIKPQFYFSIMDSEILSFQFIYINYQNEFKGYLLQLKFKQDQFYNHIISFSYCLSMEFNVVDPLQVYNTFLFQIRTGLETIPIHTVSTKEIENMKRKTGYKDALMFSPFGIEIIPYLERREFYQGLMNAENQTVEEGKHYVYLILNSRNGYFKIGRSKNPLKREKTLQAEEPEIILIKFWEADNKFEKFLQTAFIDKHVRGEWFQLSIADLFRLKEITDEILV